MLDALKRRASARTRATCRLFMVALVATAGSCGPEDLEARESAPAEEAGPRESRARLDGVMASPGGPYYVDEGSTILLDGSGSSAPDGRPLTYAWDLDGDGDFDDASGPSPSYFGTDGWVEYAVSLRVCDDAGACDSQTTSLLVGNVPPTIVSLGPSHQTIPPYGIATLSATWTDPVGPMDGPYWYYWRVGDNSYGPFMAMDGMSVVESFQLRRTGTYPVTLFVWDKDGGSAESTATTLITVRPPPPDCSAAKPSVNRLWPPDHRMQDVSILGLTDGEGNPLTVIFTSIRQDEPVKGKDADGAGLGTSTANVRAERSGAGNGRVYHLGYTATDGHGGACSGTVLVGVPHDQGRGSEPVDEGPLHDSTRP